jgi:CRP-like cAMP-binding protein
MAVESTRFRPWGASNILYNAQSAVRLLAGCLTQRAGLGAEDGAALLQLQGQVEQAGAHADIVPPGGAGDHVFFVLDGLAARFAQVLDGRRQITALHIAGDIAGLPGLVAPGGVWPLQALRATTYLRLPGAALRELAAARPGLAWTFWHESARDSAIQSHWFLNVSRRGARERLAHLLCELSVRLECAGLGKRDAFRLDATQASLGEALGLTPVHVNRMFQALRAEGLVSAAGRAIAIPDWSRLAEAADFDEAYLNLPPCDRRPANGSWMPKHQGTQLPAE